MCFVAEKLHYQWSFVLGISLYVVLHILLLSGELFMPHVLFFIALL